jgi:hypothetical protein
VEEGHKPDASEKLASSATPPNHLVPVFSCEKALNIKNIKKTRRPRSRLATDIVNLAGGSRWEDSSMSRVPKRCGNQ